MDKKRIRAIQQYWGHFYIKQVVLWWYYKADIDSKTADFTITRPFRPKYVLVWLPQNNDGGVFSSIKIGNTEHLGVDRPLSIFKTEKPITDFPESDGRYDFHDVMPSSELDFTTGKIGTTMSFRFSSTPPLQIVVIGNTYTRERVTESGVKIDEHGIARY